MLQLNNFDEDNIELLKLISEKEIDKICLKIHQHSKNDKELYQIKLICNYIIDKLRSDVR